MLAELQEAGTINDKEASAERNGKKGNQQRYESAYHNEADKSPTHISAWRIREAKPEIDQKEQDAESQ